MARVFVGNLDSRVSERDLEDEFREFGVIKSVWVARRPPGYAFVEFDDRRDAVDAISAVDGKHGWRVELSHNSKGGGGGRGGYGDSRGGRGDSRGGPRGRGGDMSCYECGEPGHFARECSLRIGSAGMGSGRRRSPGPNYRRSPDYGRGSPGPKYRRSPSYGRRSPSPRGRSPRRRERSRSRSPRYRRNESPPYANGSPVRDRRHSYSPRPAKQSPHRRPISPPTNGDGVRSQS